MGVQAGRLVVRRPTTNTLHGNPAATHTARNQSHGWCAVRQAALECRLFGLLQRLSCPCPLPRPGSTRRNSCLWLRRRTSSRVSGAHQQPAAAAATVPACRVTPPQARRRCSRRRSRAAAAAAAAGEPSGSGAAAAAAAGRHRGRKRAGGDVARKLRRRRSTRQAQPPRVPLPCKRRRGRAWRSRR